MRGRTGSWKTRYYFALVLSVGLVMAGSRLASQTPKQTGDEDFRFRPDHERENLRGQSAYKKFQAQEGIPTYGGFAVNVYDLKLGPWKRQGPGVTAAYVDLDGAGGIVNLAVSEIAVGAQTRPERHLFEEQVIVVRGEGELHVWQSDPAKKVVVPWRRGSVFAPPLNTWHQFVNKGREPARMAAVTAEQLSERCASAADSPRFSEAAISASEKSAMPYSSVVPVAPEPPCNSVGRSGLATAL